MNQKKYKYIQMLAFTMFLSGCVSTYPYNQVEIDACSQLNAQTIERQHSLAEYNVQQNTCAIVNTEHYKIYSIAPIYPYNALEKGIEGNVRIKFIVTPNEKIMALLIKYSS